MADIPTPRSRSQVLGGMISTFQSSTSLPSLPVGDPILSILEAAAQSDLRNSQDIFNLLNSLSLDNATGVALQRRGLSEGATMLGPIASQGSVTISDTSFSKIETQIYQGASAPIVGATSIKVESGDAFPTAFPFDIYVGRGTVNAEGPLEVSAATDNGSYWTFTLSSGTTKLHQLGEAVILAQGGTRTIQAGTIVQTSGGPVGSPVTFRTVYLATVPDGETEITGVQVVCQTPGSIGNIGSGSIVEFQTAPFTDAAVTNPSIFANGRDTETEDEYRNRIRKVIQSRSRGTKIAIETAIQGATSQEENKTVVSSSFVKSANQPAYLYIDDGTGYEEQSEGVAFETIIDSAIGGEQYFSLAQGRPVAKAFLETTLSAPFSLVDTSQLSFSVGGETTSHVFSAADFTSITNASAYEVSASINKDSLLDWSAKVVDNGTKVIVFAKTDTDDSIQNVAAGADFDDANVNLGFPADLSRTLRLFKDDVELSKDGRPATITSTAQSLWDVSLITSGCDLSLIVDGVDIGTTFSTFTDQDFVNAQTGYTSVSATNSLASWAKVFNYKIPGITTSVSGASLVMTSNRGSSSTASIEITGGDLSTAMFEVQEVVGEDSDYVLDRNLGQILLETPLVEGEKLTAGSYTTVGFIQTDRFDVLTVAAEATSRSGESGAELWFNVDGGAEKIANGVASGSPVDVNQDTIFLPYTSNSVNFTLGELVTGGTSSATGYISIDEDAGTTGTLTLVNVSSGPFTNGETITDGAGGTATAGTQVADTRVSYVTTQGAFDNVQEGDWVVITDLALNIDNRGAYKVCDVGALHIAVEQPAAWAASESVVLEDGNIFTTRATTVPQRVYIPAASNQTAYSLAETISTQLTGAQSLAYRTSILRIATDNQSTDGNIALIGANNTGKDIGLPIDDAVNSTDSSLGFAIANHPEHGTPQFTINSVNTVASSTDFAVASLGTIESHHIVSGLRPLSTSDNLQHFSNVGFHTPIEDISTLTIETRNDITQNWLPSDRFYTASPYDISPRDQLVTVLNEDSVSGRFVANMYRNITPTTSTYGLTNYFTDADNSGLSLAVGFGLDFNWGDFAVYMKARNLDGEGALYRYYRHGPEGENARVQYLYSVEPDADTSVEIDNTTDAYTNIAIRLPSGALRTPPTIRNSSSIGVTVKSTTGSLKNYVHVLNLPISSITRVTKIDYNTYNGTISIGDTVTGDTSLSTAQLVTAPSGSTGTVELTAVSGPFQFNELMEKTVSDYFAAASLLYGETVATLTLPTTITDHGLQIGDVVWMTSNDVNFTAGAKLITGRTATTITFRDNSYTAASGTTIGTISFDAIGEVTFTGSTVVAGDILNILDGTDMSATFQNTFKTIAVNTGNATSQHYLGPAVSTTLTWFPVNDADLIQFYPIGASNSISDITTAVNALDTIITGTEISAGTISEATYESGMSGGADPWYYLLDGINYVKTNNTPANTSANYQLTFKNDITVGLATGTDWDNEDVRIAPITAANVSDYLNIPAVSGLPGVATVNVSSGAPQIVTNTIGSSGTVEVQGGGANSNSAAVSGQAEVVSTTMMLSVVNADAEALTGQSWCAIDNGVVAPKSVFNSSTALTSLTTAGVVTISGSQAVTFATSPGQIDNTGWQIEQQGEFISYTWDSYTGASPSLSGLDEGDWVIIESAGTPGTGRTANSNNLGTFRIVRSNNTTKTFWIQNSVAVEELADLKVTFLTYDSILPGDSIVLGADNWGADNVGTWTVASIAPGTSVYQFTLDVSARAPTAASASALGSDSALFQVFEGTATRLIKKIVGISPNATNSSLTDLKFTTTLGYENVGEAYGSVVRSLDKLMFQVDPDTSSEEFLSRGTDGYKHNTGLIAECNRIVQGYEPDITSYPGVAAAGDSIYISGPMIRRVKFSVALRVTTGISTGDIANKVRSVIASAVNSADVGKSIAISQIVAAVQSVNGVDAITVLEPVFNSTNDQIQVQPYEKALVLDLDTDITVTFLGD